MASFNRDYTDSLVNKAFRHLGSKKDYKLFKLKKNINVTESDDVQYCMHVQDKYCFSCGKDGDKYSYTVDGMSPEIGLTVISCQEHKPQHVLMQGITVYITTLIPERY